MDIPRKSSQEVEIDHLLAEEFECDASFADRFIAACRPPLNCPSFRVRQAVPEPSLGGAGYGDILVLGEADGLKVALLIEDKITANPGVRQVARYKDHAARMLDEGYDHVWCVLAAPAAYGCERPLYDTSIDLEAVKLLVRSCDPIRLEYRRRIIDRALGKFNSSGVQVPDDTLLALRRQYLDFVAKICDHNN